MIRLTNDLKRILNGLAHQDAGKFLSMHQKMKILGHKPKTIEKPVIVKRVTKRIGLITDGSSLGVHIDYAIEACLRLGAGIDLLFHNAVETKRIQELEMRIRQSGVDCKLVEIDGNIIASIVEFVYSHPSLIFLVSAPDDPAASVLLEEVIPNVSVPLVLIGDRATIRKTKPSVA